MGSSIDILNWVIYKITNPNGHVYIGRTSNIDNRLNAYKTLNKGIVRQRRIYNSLLEYGYNNHIVSVIDNFTSNISYAHGKEIFWIRTNLSNYNKYPEYNGLNLGNGGSKNFGIKHLEQANIAKSNRYKGRKMPEYQKYHLKSIMKGAKSPMEGKNHTEQTKIKMSNSKKGKSSKLKGVKLSFEKRINNLSYKRGYTPRKYSKRTVISSTKNIRISVFDLNNVFIENITSLRKAKLKFEVSSNLIKDVLNGLNNNILKGVIIKPNVYTEF